jgi:hypothetical protein
MARHREGYKYYLNATIKPEIIKKLDMLRGDASHSFLIQLAIARLLHHVETGKLSLSTKEREEEK